MDGLSNREAQVLRLAAKGMAAKQIARSLGISPKTVEQHKTRAFKRLGVPNQVAAVAVLTERGASVEPIHYLRALRRRWWVIAASVVVACAAAWVTTVALATPDVQVAPRPTYSATTTLWNVQAPTLGAVVPRPDPAFLANLVTLPAVTTIATQANPAVADSKVYATTDPQNGQLIVTGTASSPGRPSRCRPPTRARSSPISSA